MNTEAKNAGTASEISPQSISFSEDAIMQPTTTSTPAVAADGMAEMTGERKADRAKQMATTTEVRPVRPPAAIPAEDSTYVVVLEVPQMAPMEVAIESANRALSILEEKPEPFSRAGADERADGVEGVGHGECEDRQQNDRQLRHVGEQRWEAFSAEDSAKGLRQLGESVADGDGVGHGGLTHRNAGDGGDRDGDQHAAAHLEHGEDDGEEQADDEQPDGRIIHDGQTWGGLHGVAVLGVGLGGEGEEADVQEADVGHEQADAAADGVLQHFRNGLDDDLTNLGDGDENVDQATQEHHAQGLLPGEAEAEANGVGEECVEAHAGGLSIRNVGEQAHDERARDGCDDGCKEHAAPRHSRLRQYLWVDDDDVRHCEERGQTGHDLSGHGGAVLLKMEELFHFSLSLFLLGW